MGALKKAEIVSAAQPLNLAIRRGRIEQEIEEANLPLAARDLLDLAIKERHRGLEYKYQMVLIWSRLKGMGDFWTKLGYKTLEQLLAMFDLPQGSVLAGWEVLVRFFNKETFCLIGDEALGEMVRSVTLANPGPDKLEERKADCQGIFNKYCKENTTFDRMKLRDTVAYYIEEKYGRLQPPRRDLPAARRMIEAAPEPTKPKELSLGAWYARNLPLFNQAMKECPNKIIKERIEKFLERVRGTIARSPQTDRRIVVHYLHDFEMSYSVYEGITDQCQYFKEDRGGFFLSKEEYDLLITAMMQEDLLTGDKDEFWTTDKGWDTYQPKENNGSGTEDSK